MSAKRGKGVPSRVEDARKSPWEMPSENPSRTAKQPPATRAQRQRPQKVKVLVPEVLPAVPTSWLVCQYHPAVSYRKGGFCDQCYAEETLQRVRTIDDGFARLVEKAITRLGEELDAEETKFFAHEGRVGDERNVIAHDIRLRALDLIGKRFKRPEQLEVRGKIQQVVISGAPVDFREAMKRKGEGA